ncbi:Crp/Fnr family transcriptional regulator [Roseivirga sp. E12]|uniref:Crp/Fnr family transcriptional regulator n=1 Tax=Roseivirga sp. E12 TaxID=2819237 RepID=UPI001ABC0550|nr:Crp/Fnr family transcriptional regulator [Roseivirga sp. E12]MBO3697724.1 Crp/Fnr family transcriptional regulator [Roseivirga sp. E12]
MTLTIDILNKINLFTEPKLREEILANCQIKAFKKGDVIVREGQFVKVVPIVVSGIIRVFQTKQDREILLYYVEPKQTCMMSLSACFFNNESPSQAVAVDKTEVLIVPTRLITKWQKEYASWNQFVIRTFRNRYDELLNTFESVAFNQIDKRVMEYLECRVSRQEDKKVKISHLELANELGTTRVVISRILKQFELDRKVKLNRGAIELL